MEGWRRLRLAQCIEGVAVPAKIPRKNFEIEGEFPVVSQEQEHINGYWSDENDVLRLDGPVVVFGDHTQVLKYIDFDFVVGADGVKILRPKGFLDPRFLYYFLMATPVKSLGYSRHYRLLKDISVVFPEKLSEQKRIVAILDAAFEAIATATARTEQNLVNARKVFEEAVRVGLTARRDGWFTTTLGESLRLKSGASLTAKMMVSDGQYSVYGGNGINGKHNEYNCEGENVVVGRVGAHCGNVHLVNEKFWLTDNAFRVSSCSYDFAMKFLAYLLRAVDLRSAARQAAQPVISNSSLRDVVLSFPRDVSQQKAIVAKLDALSAETQRLESLYRSKLELLTELKQSVLAKAFRGELTAESKADEAVVRVAM